MESVFEKFTDTIKTKEQLDRYLEQIRQASRWVYKGGSLPLSEKIKGTAREEFRQFVRELEEAGQIPSARRDESTFLKNIAKTWESLPVIRLKLAFLPSDDFLDDLTEWLAKQTGRKVVLDIEVDERIIGGCTFEYAGEYRDCTLEAKLDEVLEAEVRRMI